MLENPVPQDDDEIAIDKFIKKILDNNRVASLISTAWLEKNDMYAVRRADWDAIIKKLLDL